MHIAIIGNGIAGITAARNLRKYTSHKITIISGETTHFFSRTALMYLYMKHLRYEDAKPYEDSFWAKNRLDLLHDWVERVDTQRQTLQLRKHGHLAYDILILATGSRPRGLACVGSDLAGVQGLYSYQDLELLENRSPQIEQAIVVGGGLIGVEWAEMLRSRQIDVTMLIRESSYWGNVLPKEESKLVSQHIQNQGIQLLFNTEIEAIVGTKSVQAVRTNRQTSLPCQLVGAAIGVQPNINWLRADEAHGIELNQGILVDNYLKTNVQNIYAIGDCAELREPAPLRQAIESTWYTSRQMGETVAATIAGKPTRYEPRLWFNSAKFFNLEYQTYGHVPPAWSAAYESVHWQHATDAKSIRILYEVESLAVVGFVLLGVRYRHDVCERWILAKTSIESVLERLPMANFDGEFSPSYEAELLQIYNQRTGKNLQLRSRRGLSAVWQWLRGGG